MSRIGRMPIAIPNGVDVALKDSEVTVKGPKGQLTMTVVPGITVTREDNALRIARPSDEGDYPALHGLTRSLIANMVEGVVKGYEKALDIVGVGYRAQKAGQKLNIFVGFTHPVEVEPPPSIEFAVEGQNRIVVRGPNKQLVGDTAARIRRIRPPDAYKGKGIRYAGEHIRLKPGKAAAKKTA